MSLYRIFSVLLHKARCSSETGTMTLDFEAFNIVCDVSFILYKSHNIWYFCLATKDRANIQFL